MMDLIRKGLPIRFFVGIVIVIFVFLLSFLLWRNDNNCSYKVTFFNGETKSYNQAKPNDNGFTYLVDCNGDSQLVSSKEIKRIKRNGN